MSSLAAPELNPLAPADPARRSRLDKVDRRANGALKWLALGGGALVFIALLAIVYQILSGASSAFDKFGFAFIFHKTWIPAANEFGAWTFIYGTLVTGLASVALATLLGVSIGLFLSLMAPRRVAAVIGPLVEMLAAIPSVVIGLIGIYLICPFIKSDIEPWVHSAFGWIPIFGGPQQVGNSIFAAILVLTIMVVPIIAALTRDLFLTVPGDLRDGAEALGATRWEMIRGVVIPTTQSGIVAACVLGFGRAIGEAIAVSQVIGDVPVAPLNLFKGGYSLGPVMANQFPSPVSALHTSALFYLAAILLVLGIATNMSAQWISRRFGPAL
ncbi:MAG TPA: phosphate ABC transporter permease subunit PstC [Solirubrobacteraceae bacterium]|nr:phosphate ABC transporter permease subunit PstC [Solirubrobacteraceae bacterium]